MRRSALRVLRYGLLLFLFTNFVVPLGWMGISALKSSREISVSPLSLPSELAWDNIARAWTVGRFSDYLLNSVIYGAATVIGVVVLSCLAGYALARRPDLPAMPIVFALFLLGIMLPFQALMIPLYYLANDLGILGTRAAMILPGIALGLPFGVFLMRAFFQDLPQDLIDAAKLDGCGEFEAFWRVVLPLAMPGVATVTVFQFMETWNAFLLPLIMLQAEDLRPVSLGLMFFTGRYTADRGLIAAGILLSSLPILLLYLGLQRYFIRGITSGAIK